MSVTVGRVWSVTVGRVECECWESVVSRRVWSVTVGEYGV